MSTLPPYRPRTCVWETTLACNLRCKHCGSDAGARRCRELTTDECLRTIDQLAELECQLLTFSGGEPTLRPDWSILVRAAVRRGITVNLVSNGTTMTRELAARAAELGLANIGVSLDGPEPIHDGLRGEGVFRRTVRGIEHLRAAGVPVAALTHLNQDTARALPETHELVRALGCDLWRLQLGKPMGRLQLESGLLLEPRELLEVIPAIARLQRSSPLTITVGDSLGYFGPHEPTLRRLACGAERSWAGCQAGLQAVGIESDGGVKGCLSLQGRLEGQGERDAFREGSLRERSLAELWFDPGAFAFNRRWAPDQLRGACRKCEHAALCRGGAKCVAAAFLGRLDENEHCYYRQERLARGARPRLAAVREHALASALASALALGVGLLGLGGCGSRSVPVGDGGGDLARAGDLARSDRGQPRRDGSSRDRSTDRTLPPDADVCAGYTCHNTCPACEYGIEPPQELFAQCCCKNVCCECDYGVSPPPGCCK